MTSIDGTRAAVQWAEGKRWWIEGLQVDPPGDGTARLRMETAGLSDLTMIEWGCPWGSRPMVGGHECVGVIVSVHDGEERQVDLSPRDLQATEKQVLGCRSGSWHGRRGAAFLLDLTARGRYDASGLVGSTYGLADIEQGRADQPAGRTHRAVLTFDRGSRP